MPDSILKKALFFKKEKLCTEFQPKMLALRKPSTPVACL
jgi:hypothetical protein